MVAAVGAGVLLVQQQQDIRERAAANLCPGEDPTTAPPGDRYWQIYKCPNVFETGSGCQSNREGPFSSRPVFESPYCGLQQVDCTYVGGPGYVYTDSKVDQAGCTTTPSQPPTGGGCGTPCTDVSQCNISGAVNQACSNGVCWDAAVCESPPASSPPGGGLCGSSCSSDSQCTDGSICFQNKCINPECKRNPGACDLTRCTAVVACEQTDCRIAGSVCESQGTCNQSTGVCDCGVAATAQCVEIKAYDANWVLLTAQDLTLLKPGDVVRFTVAGTATSGAFDQARFTVNGTQRTPVTTKKPGSTTEFFDAYTVLAGDTGLTVSAQVHHVEMDIWY